MTLHRVCPQPRCAELNAHDALYCHECRTPLVPPEALKPRCAFCGCKVSPRATRCREHQHLRDWWEAA